ncbi:ribosomal L1 domain-containing protein 1-like [Paramacrobiotus metropolitanus]|uniref:ribosomal L1 domain-containing protein 1-like n=1 Tax=Paramacrobiotus metropolitanus TaxID=2943436 RepID=UPI00244584B7|nr:ribosomal L1 domain-containing protein 1-like [Paramacrobiotus metropolitanus]
MECTETKILEAATTLLRGQDASGDNSKPKIAGQKVPLLPEKDNIFLTIVQKRFAEQKYRRIKCDLPKPFRILGSCDVCLIIKDISHEKNFDQERGVEKYKELLRRAGVDGITEVLTFTQLRGEYKAYEAKRKLLHRYDLFLADERIYGNLAKVLGKKFFQKNAFPLPVDVVNSESLSGALKSAIQATYVTILGKGPQSSVEVGSAEQSGEDIRDNIVSVLAQVRSRFPGGWENIRSIYVKLGKVSLPVYIDSASPNSVSVPKPEATDGFTAGPEEITTVKEGKVKLTKYGKVKIIKKKKRVKKGKTLKKKV